MASALDTAFRFYQNALDLRAYRQQLLASNIANADTPNYKAVDIDFARALQGAQEARGQLPLSTTAPGHLHGRPSNPLDARVMYRAAVQPSIDGNTVDTDIEMAQFSDNALHYQAALTFMSGRIKTLMSAIQGQ